MPTPPLSRRHLKSLSLATERLAALLDTLDSIDRTVPLPLSLLTNGRRALADAHRLIGETPFQPLPPGDTIMPAELFVATLKTLDAAKALFRDAKIAAARSPQKIYPRRLQRA